MATLSLLDIDANLRQTLNIPEDTLFFDALSAPFACYGLPDHAGVPPCRLPPAVLEQASPQLRALSYHTAGVRVRFATDASAIHLAAELYEKCLFPHMPLTGTSGIDVFSDGYYRSTVRPGFDPDGSPALWYMGSVTLPGSGLKQVTLYLPLYNGIRSLSVGLPPKALLQPGTGYRLDKPVLFYGSSITQGGCACRTSTCYTALVSRWLDVDHINLGFSGNALGEPFMARYIASLPLAALVLDYDHNAPDAAHLTRTHGPFFDIIRASQPQLPVLMMSRPDFVAGDPEMEARRAAVRDTYEKAQAAGDRQVWFLDGETLLEGRDRSGCTVDGCHPNDLGFMRMAQRVEPLLRQMLGFQVANISPCGT